MILKTLIRNIVFFQVFAGFLNPGTGEGDIRFHLRKPLFSNSFPQFPLIQGLGSAYIHYHNIPSRFIQEVASAPCVTENYNGSDLRQLQRTSQNGKDRAPHIYFDTKTILNGESRPKTSNFYSKHWLEENVLSSSKDIEECAAFYKMTPARDPKQHF